MPAEIQPHLVVFLTPHNIRRNMQQVDLERMFLEGVRKLPGSKRTSFFLVYIHPRLSRLPGPSALANNIAAAWDHWENQRRLSHCSTGSIRELGRENGRDRGRPTLYPVLGQVDTCIVLRLVWFALPGDVSVKLARIHEMQCMLNFTG